MKFISFFLAMLAILWGCQTTCDVSKIVPEFRLIKRFSAKLKEDQGLKLYSYGINNNVPKDYTSDRIVYNFSVSYVAYKTQQDIISLEDARHLLISTAESFLAEINSDPEVKDRLDQYPLSSDRINICIIFEDENHAGLGNGGVQRIYLSNGQIKYRRYEIQEYKAKDTIGTNFLMHQESYSEALQKG